MALRRITPQKDFYGQAPIRDEIILVGSYKPHGTQEVDTSMATLPSPRGLQTDTAYLEQKWPLLLTLFCIAVLLPIIAKGKRNPRNLPLPPGPKGIPIFGNLFQLSREAYRDSGSWRMYSRWAKEYGMLVACESGMSC